MKRAMTVGSENCEAALAPWVIFQKHRPDWRSDSVRSADRIFAFFRRRGGHRAVAAATLVRLAHNKDLLMRTEEPRAINLKDYRAPDYRIGTIALDFALEPLATRVKATSQVTRTGAAAPLTLDGEALKLLSIAIDRRTLDDKAYTLDENTLTILAPPANFTLELVTEISPEKNTELSGLYTANGIFCTQCEAEGFRRITYFLDRPDNLAVYTTRIEADKTKYPVLLSNGNPIARGDLPGGRHFVTWNDPFP